MSSGRTPEGIYEYFSGEGEEEEEEEREEEREEREERERMEQIRQSIPEEPKRRIGELVIDVNE